MDRSSQFHLRHRPKLRKLCRHTSGGGGGSAIVDQVIRGRYTCLDSWTSSNLSVMASHDTDKMYRSIAFNTRSFTLHFLGRLPRAHRPAKDIEARKCIVYYGRMEEQRGRRAVALGGGEGAGMRCGSTDRTPACGSAHPGHR